MSSVVISGDTSGAITLAAPAVSGTNTATLPAATGTVMVSGNMPAFSATPNNTTVTSGTFTKIAYANKEFDTNNNYDSTTNYRFTPTVAGYYQVNASFSYSGVGLGGANSLIALYKNGSWFKTGNGGNFTYYNIAALVYCNGTTDYLEIYAYQSSGLTQTAQSGTTYQFSASMVRTA